MDLKKIEKKEFEKLEYSYEKYYYANGAIWENETDNLIAFPKYTRINDDEITEYYKIIEKSIDE